MLERMTKTIAITLNDKYRRFADKYLETGNASESARFVGYSAKCAGVTGSKLLARPDIAAYLAERRAEVLGDEATVQQRVLGELEALAFANIADFISIDDDGLPQVDFSNASREQLRAITNIATKRTTRRDKDGNVTTEEQSRFGLTDKYRGLELLGKHHGLFKAEEQRVVVDVADRLLHARQRLRQLDDGAAE